MPAKIDNIFRKMCRSRYFDESVMEARKDGRVTCPLYLHIGQESAPATLSELFPTFKVFPQHRGHGWYLSFGGEPTKLRDELLGLDSGCSRGRGGSACIQSHNIKGYHDFIGENVPIAVGYSLGSGESVIATFGDGASEEDYVFPALGFAVTKKLPILFVCEDNNLSILTKVDVRRSWKIADVAKSFGMPSFDVEDNPEEIVKALEGVTLPAFINIRTCRHRWHVGIGKDSEPEKDRLKVLREANDFGEIEEHAKKDMGEIWKA